MLQTLVARGFAVAITSRQDAGIQITCIVTPTVRDIGQVTARETVLA